MLLLGAACKLLSVGMEKVDLASKTPPFKLKPDNECFKTLVDILYHQFTKPTEFYNKGLYGAIEFIYKVIYCYSIFYYFTKYFQINILDVFKT